MNFTLFDIKEVLGRRKKLEKARKINAEEMWIDN